MIRNATSSDLMQIASVHIECFQNSFSTKLGSGRKNKLLQKLYIEYLNVVPELFFVAVNDKNQIIGFCMGYYCDNNNFQKYFLKHNFFSISVKIAHLLISGNKTAWKKLLHIFKSKDYFLIFDKHYSEVLPNNKANILSIAVLPQYRGSGLAADLIKEFEETAKLNGKGYCQLTVETGNTRGISFYEKMGYKKYKQNNEKIFYYKTL